jgi:dolichol-phosphate mannosyltransferase
MKLSIIVPAYNEEKTIVALLDRVFDVDFGSIEGEVLVVDDGSKDRTGELLRAYNRPLKVITHAKNSGKGSAIQSGIKEATGDYVVIQDADLEYDPNDLKILLDTAIVHKAKAVFGSRRLSVADSVNAHGKWYFYAGGVFLTTLANILYGTHITDEPTCYKLIDRDLLNALKIESVRFEFCPEVTAKIGRLKIPIFEVPIHYNPRSASEGKKIKAKDGIEAIWTLVKYRFSRKPEYSEKK